MCVILIGDVSTFRFVSSIYLVQSRSGDGTLEEEGERVKEEEMRESEEGRKREDPTSLMRGWVGGALAGEDHSRFAKLTCEVDIVMKVIVVYVNRTYM